MVIFKKNQTIEITEANHQSTLALWETYSQINKLLASPGIIKSQVIGNFNITIIK